MTGTAAQHPRGASAKASLPPEYRRPSSEEWDWQLHARCRGLSTDIFFAADHDRGARRLEHEKQAKQVCLSCPVRQRCLRHALNHPESHGIWGATTPRERWRMLPRIGDGGEVSTDW